MTKNRIWIIATALISAIVILAGWFLAISPKLDEAAAAASELESVEAVNELEEVKLAALKAQFENIDEITEELEGLRLALPPGAQYSQFLRQADAAAVGNGIALSSITLGTASWFAPDASTVVPEPEAAPTEEGAEADATAEPAATDESGVDPATAEVPTSTGRVTGENFITIEVNFEVAGSYDAILGFINGMQTVDRLFLVTSLSTTLDAAPAAPADPDADAPAAPVAQTYKGNITGLIYVLIDSTYAEAIEGDVNGDGVVDDKDTEPAEEPTPTPTPTDEPAE